MKNPAKIIVQLILILSLILPLTQIASAENRSQADKHVSFTVIASDEESLELLLSAPFYEVGETQIDDMSFDTLTVPGTVNSANPGQPQLPIASRLFAVPPGAEVRLEILQDNHQQLPGTYQLAPAPYPAKFDETAPSQRWDYFLGTRIQLSDPLQINPLSPVRLSDEAWIRDQRVVRLEYSPLQMDAETGGLLWHPSVWVKVHFDFPLGSADTSFSESTKNTNSSLNETLTNSLLNSEQAMDWRTSSPPSEVLVTPPGIDQRYRISIEKDGIYKLTYHDLIAANPAIINMDPRYLHMSNQGEDVAIHIFGQDDGRFDPGDYIIFYGQRFKGERLAQLYQNENQHWYTYPRQATDGTYFLWKPEFNEIMLEKYTQENVYWLYSDSTFGLRMNSVNGNPSGNNNDPVDSYRETVRLEESNWWSSILFAGEETWFWDLVYAGGIVNFEASISAPTSSGPNAIIRTEFVSAYEDSRDGFDHHTKIYFNSGNIGEFKWSGMSRYVFEHEITAGTIVEGINTLGIEALTDEQVINPKYYFDWFEIEYNRNFVAQDNAIIFKSPVSGLQKYQVNGFTDTSGLWVLDITDPLQALQVQNANIGANQVTISLDHIDLSIAMDSGGQMLLPGQVTYYQSPNWINLSSGADYVFITHKKLVTTTQSLANFRENSGLSSVVIDINDLYNEFNFGIYNPIAIKNFLSYTFENWDIIPVYTLLVGDGHWNFQGHNLDEYGAGDQLMPPHLAWADPWQGEVDSANLLATIIGDDPLPDLRIARLPVNNDAELNAYINKLMDYEISGHQNWEQTHIIVADNPDSAGDFTSFAEDIVQQYIDPFDHASAQKIYQEDYGCVSGASVECDNVRNDLINGINTGSVIVSFIGHASVRRWSHEQVFTPAQYPDLTNTGKLPILLSLNCLDGYWSLPANKVGQSMIEEIVRLDDTGAIAAFSPTGLGVSTGHDVLHKGFYHALMVDGDWELGSATQISKLRLYESGRNLDLLNTYTVFGDPALQIKNPFSFIGSPEQNEKIAPSPGSKVTHTLTLENTGTVTDSYEIAAKYIWETTIITATAQVPPGGRLDIPVEVTTPLQYGVEDTTFITVTSKGNRYETFYSQLTTIIPLVYGYQLSPTESNQLARPGDTIDHTFTLTHTGEEQNSYLINISGNSWPTNPSTSLIETLQTGETAQFSVSVETPNQKDVSDNATLTITPVDGLPQSVDIPLTTRVPRDFEFSVSPESFSGFAIAGSNITYTLTIQNTGLQYDRYQVEVTDSNWVTTLSATQTDDLDFLGSAQIQVYVNTPSQENLTDVAIINVTSLAVPSESQQATFTTSTIFHKIYLPLIGR